MKFIIFVLILISGAHVFAQQPVFNHYYANPYIYNPAFAGSLGTARVSASTRMQWIGSENPVSAAFLTAELPLQKNIAIAGSFYNDRQGLMNSTSGLLTVAYHIMTGIGQRLSFGLSAGALKRNINLDKLNVTDQDDPAIDAIENNSTGMAANFGVNYQYKGLNMGFALPELFSSTNYTRQKNQDHLKRFLISASYKINSEFAVLEPQMIFRTGDEVNGKVEGMMTMYFRDTFWIGGLYRFEYGPAFYGGFKISQQIKAGYAFETSPVSRSGSINGTHEIFLSYQFAKKP